MDKRQRYRVILQLMTYISIAILLWVMFSSMFVTDEKSEKKSTEIIEISLQQLAKGELTHVLWQGKKVSILHRNDREDKTYLVYYDLGDSGNCPLFFTGNVLKDTCTGTQYNQKGEPIQNNRLDDLASPPHYFMMKQKKVVIGK